MDNEALEYLRDGAEHVRRLNSSAPEGRNYSLTVEVEGLTVRARQRGREVKYILDWALLDASVINPIPDMVDTARARLEATLREEDR